MIDDEVRIVVRPNDSIMLDNTYVVFDFETTGFNAGIRDSIIEIGAVKILNGEIIDEPYLETLTQNIIIKANKSSFPYI